MSQTRIDILPGVGIFRLLKSLSYKPQYALAEYVDNSIASYEKNKIELRRINPKYKLRIVLQLGSNEIRIRDNAGGISKKDYPRAFKPAELPDDRTGLNEFGMGMKTASIWLSRKWKVITDAIGEHETGIVEFDVNKIIDSKEAFLAPLFKPKTRAQNHGTEIILTELNHSFNAQVVRRIKEHLASIYRKYLLSDEVDILILGDGDSEVSSVPLKPYKEAPALLAPKYTKSGPVGKELKWEKNINILLKSGRSIQGSAKILSKGSTSNAGLYLFRRNRLILSADEPFRPEEIFGRGNSYQSQRLFIELDMKGFEVAHTKDDFIWGLGGDDKSQVVDKIKEALQGGELQLITQAENYRAKEIEHKEETVKKNFYEKTTDALDELKKNSPQLGNIDESKPLPENYLATNSIRPIETVEMQITISGEDWFFQVSAIKGDRFSPLFRNNYINQGNSGHKCEISLNIDNAFAVNLLNESLANFQILSRIAIATSYAQSQSIKANSRSPGFIVTNINRMLTEFLSGSK